jgi:hypothetical protein
MTPEGKVKAKVKAVLKSYGAYWHCPVQNGMGSPSLDFVGCYYGLFYAIETKAGNKRPTPRQEMTIEDMVEAGGKVFVINEVTGTEELEAWLKLKKESC